MTFRWGIFGTGGISAKFVAGLAAADDAAAVMVASRTLAGAQAFAGKFGIARPIAGYQEAARAGGVDAIYIATPSSEHLPHALACIEAGIPVLVEKPLAQDAGQAIRLRDAARAAGVFCMEGMWTRFIPAARHLRDRLADGAIGEPRIVSGSFGVSKQPDPGSSSFSPERGGGALTELGIYPLSLAQWIFGTPVDASGIVRIGETGVEEDAAIAVRYPGGAVGSFHCSIRSFCTNDFRVAGTNGALALAGPIFRPHGVSLLRHPPRAAEAARGGRLGRLRESGLVQRLAQLAGASGTPSGKRVRVPFSGNGYHYEADEVARCVRAGCVESADMPLDDSIATLALIDRIKSTATARPAEERS